MGTGSAAATDALSVANIVTDRSVTEAVPVEAPAPPSETETPTTQLHDEPVLPSTRLRGDETLRSSITQLHDARLLRRSNELAFQLASLPLHFLAPLLYLGYAVAVGRASADGGDPTLRRSLCVQVRAHLSPFSSSSSSSSFPTIGFT
jgi:hypothetical protein